MIQKVELIRRAGKSELPGIAGPEELMARLTDSEGSTICFSIVDSNVKTDRTSAMTHVEINMGNGSIHLDNVEVQIVKE